MKRKFKTLGLALAAVCAMSVMAASAASAAEFHSAVHPQTVSGVQTTNHVFTTTSGKITCKTVTFSGTTAAKTSATQTMTPNYDGCTAFGFINVPVHENGCDYTFAASGTTNLVCPAGKQIEITVPGCTNTVTTQHFATGNVFSNNAAKTDINVTTNISDITYRECDGVLRHDATYTGTTTITGASGAIFWTP